MRGVHSAFRPHFRKDSLALLQIAGGLLGVIGRQIREYRIDLIHSKRKRVAPALRILYQFGCEPGYRSPLARKDESEKPRDTCQTQLPGNSGAMLAQDLFRFLARLFCLFPTPGEVAADAWKARAVPITCISCNSMPVSSALCSKAWLCP
jgi:hypothetical protein